MSVPNSFSDPKLHSKIIQNLQSLMQQGLPWLQYVYPLAHVGITLDAEGNELKYPRTHINDGENEYYDIRPNDSFRSYGFFEIADSTSIDEDGQIVYNVSFIVWFNYNTTSAIKSYDYHAELIKDVIALIDANIYFKQAISNISYDIDPNTIFNKYSLKLTDSQFLMYPYGAFKINFDFTDYEVFCDGTPNTITLAPTSSQVCEIIRNCIPTELSYATKKFIILRLVDYSLPHIAGTSVGGRFEMPFSATLTAIYMQMDVTGTGGSLVITIRKNGSVITPTYVTLTDPAITTRNLSQPTISSSTLNKGDIITVDILSTETVPGYGLTVELDTTLTSL